MKKDKKLLMIGGLILCILVFLWLVVLRSSPELSEEKFADVYVQLSIAKEIFAADTIQLEAEKKRIFEEAGVTQDEIDAFVKRCNQEPDRWARVWKKIVGKLEEKRQDLK